MKGLEWREMSERAWGILWINAMVVAWKTGPENLLSSTTTERNNDMQLN